MNLLHSYLNKRYERVVLNGQSSSWELIKSGASQGSFLGLLMFLIYINNLRDNIQSTCKIIADDTSLFSHVSDKTISQCELNKGLQVLSNWFSQLKMQFNRDPNKQRQEVNVSKKADNVSSLPVIFNNKNCNLLFSKAFWLVLDQQLNFNNHIQSKMTKCYKMIGIVKRLSVNICCWGLINHLSDPIWTTEILFMTNLITSNLKQNWNYSVQSLCCNNWCHSRNISWMPLSRTRFRIFRKYILVSKIDIFREIVKGATLRHFTSYLKTNDKHKTIRLQQYQKV